ncbi:MAG: preprotein translocase subunit SecG [Alphaproteobacteria bacterium]|nr:preprotein translocase subunit SecG [Alphaproteobacteria bacterium]
MDTVLLVIHLLVAVALIGVILMQRSAQDGGGLMGGSSTMGGLFTARGSANLLSRTTAILATIFIALSLILAIMAGQKHEGKSIAERIAPLATQTETTTEAPQPAKVEEPKAAPAAPAVPVAK